MEHRTRRDRPIAEITAPKIDAWAAYENADLAVQISPELTLVVPALVTLKGDLISSHLCCNKDY